MNEPNKPVNVPKFVPPTGAPKPMPQGAPKPFPGAVPPPPQPQAPAYQTAPNAQAPKQKKNDKGSKKALIIILAAAAVVIIGVALTLILSLGGNSNEYDGPYSEVNGAYGGVDDLGRELYYEAKPETSPDPEKEVGVFYFFAQGNHGDSSKARDNSLIVQEHPEAVLSEANWIAAGGGDVNIQHFWGKPLFGYYKSNDPWVKRRQVEMLTATGVDYLVIDATNTFTYDGEAGILFSVLLEYQQQGWDVPKVAYYTHTDSEATMKHIYEEIYLAHPEYDPIWYKIDGKPLIIGDTEDPTLQAYFKINPSQWPQFDKVEYGFPWMEFDRYMTDDAVCKLTDTKTIMSVSPAQHNVTCCFSATAWYGYNDRSRSYAWQDFGYANEEQGMLYGSNYQKNFEYALSKNVDNIFITGFNEWVAGRQPTSPDAPDVKISFVDCADPNNSRDIEPMDGVLKDNYLMQTANMVKEFKGSDARVDVGENKTIDINGDFSQFDGVPAVYKDFLGDTMERGYLGYGKMQWNKTNRNDIVNMKVCMDDENIYFYVDTAEEMTGQDKGGFMNLFLRSHGATTDKAKSWEGFDYVINRTAPNGTELTVEKSAGGWNWTVVGTASYRQEGNKMMLKVSKALLGITDEEPIDIQFKWVDNAAIEGDVMEFYTDGDTAPYGRYTYIFSKKAYKAEK